MRNGQLKPRFNKGIKRVDWSDTPDHVLEAVDKALKEYGLEVMMYDEESDQYVFSITTRLTKRK